MHAPLLSVSLLGAPRVEVDGDPLEVDTRKAVALVAYLALEGEARRDTLAALFWPESGPERARSALRRTLSTLKSALGDGLLQVDRERVALERSRLRLDVDELRQLVASCGGHGHPAAETCARCVEPLRRAAALDRGTFLDGFGLRDSAPFDDWLQRTAAELRREQTGVLDRLGVALAAAGDHGGAAAVARRHLEEDPLYEPAHRRLIGAYAAAGDRLAALEQYRACVRVLDRELGVRPLEETTSLYHAVLEGTVPSAPPASPPAADEGQGYPLTGRAGELGRLRQALDGVGPDGAVVGIAGEPGIGKTRLATELTATALAEGRPALTVRCFAEEGDLAYGTATALVRGALEGREVDPTAWWVGEAARLLPELGDAPSSPLDRPGAKARFLESLTELVASVFAGPSPGVVVVDDAHWADAASLSALSFLANRLAGRPLLLVLTWRDDELGHRHPLRRVVTDAVRARRGTVLSLGRLDESAVVELTRAAGHDQGLGRRLFEETRGLPFFLVEYLDAIGRGEAVEEVPLGVRELLQARVAATSDLAQQVAGTAAVVGPATAEILRDASGRSDDEVVQALDELIGHGIVVETVEGDYAFRHDQARTLVYDDLSRARRRLLHRRAAGALAGHPDAVVARHLELAGDHAGAAARYRAAGDRARALFANDEARAHYAAALALGDPGRAELHAALGDLDTLAGDYGGAIEQYDSAAAHATEAELPVIEHRIGSLHLRRGGMELADARLAAALPGLDQRGAARVLADRSLVARRTGRHDEAERLAVEALALADAAGDGTARAQAHSLLGMLADEQGDHEMATRELEAGLVDARAADDAAAEVAALNNLALVAGRGGDAERALGLASEALALCRRLGDRHREAALRNNLADLLHRAGRLEESMDELKRAVALFAEVGEEGRLEPEIWKLSDW